MIKVVLNIITFVIALFLLNGCDCDQQDPTVRFRNSSNNNIIDVQLKTSDGKTEEFDIFVDTSMGPTAIDPGETEFIVFGESVTDSIVYQFEAEFCTKYELELHPDNSITRRNLVTP